MTTIDFCIPIFNEAKILGPNIRRLREYLISQNFTWRWRLILIVNGSVDDSWSICQTIEREAKAPVVCVNFPESGKGRALKQYSRLSEAEILVYMDVDLAVSLHNIPDLIKPVLAGQADLVVGSRLLPDSRIDRSFWRELSSQTYNFLSKIILGHNFSDLQCGFKAIRTVVFRQLEPEIRDNQWFFDTELIAFAHRAGYRIKEIPVDWSENRWDQRKSKVNLFRDSLRFIINLVKLKIRILKIRPEKNF